MAIAGRLTQKIVQPHNPGSLSRKARQRRWTKFEKTFPELEAMRVLDLGGTPAFWRSAPNQPHALTIVNLARQDVTTENVTTVQGDACAPPTGVLRERYDLVVSNSLIEHVGGHMQRVRLAM
jgi:hypothetical protein